MTKPESTVGAAKKIKLIAPPLLPGVGASPPVSFKLLGQEKVSGTDSGLFRSSLRSQGRFEAQPTHGSVAPLLVAKRAAAIHALPHRRQLGVRERLVDVVGSRRGHPTTSGTEIGSGPANSAAAPPRGGQFW